MCEDLSSASLVSGKQDLGEDGALLDWVNTEMENFKRFAETGES